MNRNAYNVRTHVKAYQEKVDVYVGVKMTAEDEEFDKENCHGSRGGI